MLKKYWKSNWFLASIVSLAFLLLSDMQAQMQIKLSAAKPKVIGNTIFVPESQTHPSLSRINQIADIVAQPNTLNLVPELAQLSPIILKASSGLNTDTQVAARSGPLIMSLLV